jgi:hypothetical protein
MFIYIQHLAGLYIKETSQVEYGKFINEMKVVDSIERCNLKVTEDRLVSFFEKLIGIKNNVASPGIATTRKKMKFSLQQECHLK